MMLNLTRRAQVAGLLAVGALLGGAVGVTISQLGVATAASPTPSPGPGFPGPGDMMRDHGLLGGPGMMLGGPGGRVLHGEATVQLPNGKTQVVHFQHGTITDVGGSTMSVRSSDGFTATYTVNATTRISLNGSDGSLSKLKKGDDVRVFAVTTGSSTVAKAVMDGVPQGFGDMGRGGGWMMRHQRRAG